MFKTSRTRRVAAFSMVLKMMLLLVSQPIAAATPERLTLAPTDRVFWKGKGSENYLILNVFAHEAKLKAMSPQARNTLLLNTGLVESARTLDRTEYKSLTELSVLVVNMKDMSEYGGSSSKWTQVGTAKVLKGASTLELKDVKFDGAMPSPLPTLPFPFKEASTSETPSALRFMMPERMYLVAGTPQHFFYENLITVKDAGDYVFVPSGNAVGLATYNRRGLEFNAKEALVGEHPLAIKVTDWEGKTVAEGSTKVTVLPALTPPAAMPAEPYKILIIGHSLPSMYWPAYLADYLAGPGNPTVQYIGGIKYWYGTYPDIRNSPPLDAMFHQASPGYSINTLLKLYSDTPPANPNMPSKSPFMFKDGSGPAKLDMARYLKETLKGQVPNFILLNVGDNDTFNLNPDEKDPPAVKEFMVNMNTFLDHLRQMAPKATFGVMLPNTYNYSERSFVHNYGPQNPRWKQVQNRQRYIELMTEIAKSRKDIAIIPSNMVVDGIDGMPYNSGTHFNNIGARQFAGSAYAWLKAQFVLQSKSQQGSVAPTTAAPAAQPAPTPAKAEAKKSSGWFGGLFGR